MGEHLEIKHKIQNINKKSIFIDLLEESMLCDKEKQIMIKYYVEKKNFNLIADELGYSEVWVKKMHKKILKKLGSLL